MRLIVLTTLLLPFAGCVSDQARSDIAVSAATSYNAAASLPASPQVQAIEANQAAIANAVGHPLTVTATGAVVSP